MKKNIFYSILFLFFLFIFSIFYIGLDKPNFYTPKEIKNKKLETFSSKELFSNEQFQSNDLIKVNKFTILNIWASWCIPCKQEHSLLMDLKNKTDINIIGLNYKDKKNIEEERQRGESKVERKSYRRKFGKREKERENVRGVRLRF